MKRIRNTITACLTGGIQLGKCTGYQRHATHDEIALLAYRYYESRGRQDGHHSEDWLRAEQELMGCYK
jgi:hypothetical protein